MSHPYELFPFGFEPLMKGYDDFVWTDSERGLFRFNFFIEFVEVQEVDLALFIDYTYLQLSFLEFDIEHFLSQICLCAIW